MDISVTTYESNFVFLIVMLTTAPCKLSQVVTCIGRYMIIIHGTTSVTLSEVFVVFLRHSRQVP